MSLSILMADPSVAFKRIVVKVGSSVLTEQAGKLDPHRLKQLVEQLAECVSHPREVVLVSSGAIACGMARLGLKRRPKDLVQLQACAAIGQGELMHRYSEAFGAHDLTVAQVLLTQEDLEDRRRCLNAKQTLLALLEQKVVPIVNENDTVSVSEIAFGDNDRLAALVACLVHAQLLVMLSDVDGLLHHGRVIERIDQLNHDLHAIALGASRETTTGGMASKLAAARLVRHSAIPLIIANGTRPNVLREILAGKPVGTLVVPPAVRLRSRKWWIAFAARHPKGTIVIDHGAKEALVARGKSLLASGIREVHGQFDAGEAIAIVDESHAEIARGLSNFSSTELTRIRGMKTHQIEGLIGRKVGVQEAVHRDNLVVLQEPHG